MDVPLGDFFAVGHGYERDVDSLPIRDSSYGRARNSYWSMPSRKSCRITVTDEGKRPVTMFYYHVDWQQHPSLAEDVAYFHGYYRQERPAAVGRNYAFLDVKGTGHYVGTVLNVIRAGVGWFGEGDDLFFVDGAAKPQIYGTGTEDYLSDAWGLRVSTGPWTGTPVAEGELVGAPFPGTGGMCPIRFSLRNRYQPSLNMRVGPTTTTVNWDPASSSVRTIFRAPPSGIKRASMRMFAEPPYGADRLPLGNAMQIAVGRFRRRREGR